MMPTTIDDDGVGNDDADDDAYGINYCTVQYRYCAVL